MSGESFFLDEVVKFGDPWHGLWRAATNQVTPPAGPAFTCPGVPPNGSLYQPYGASYKLAKPGVAATSNDAADNAAGRTWLNYAIMSGSTMRLYGRDLGGPIYIAPDGTPWKVDTVKNYAFAGTTGTLTIDVTFHSFGDFDEAAAPVTQTLATLTATCATPTPYTPDIYRTKIDFEDVSSDGAKSLIALYDAGYTRGVLGIFELSISGTPPAATATLTKITDGTALAAPTSVIDQHWKIASATGAYPSHTITYISVAGNLWPDGMLAGTRSFCESQNDSRTIEYLIGARYSGATTEVITMHCRELYTGTGDISAVPVPLPDLYQYTVSSSSQVQITCELKANGAAIDTRSMTISATASGVFTTPGGAVFPVTSSTTYSLGGGSTTVTGAEQMIVGTSYGSLTHYGVLGPNANNNTYGDSLGWRYSNKVYGMYSQEPKVWGDSSARQTLFHKSMGVIGSDASTISAASFAAGPIYGTEHPVTGQVVRDTTPVCWI